MHKRWLESVHEMHSFRNIQSHFMPLSECYMWNRFFLFVQDLKQSSTMTKLCHYNWMPFVCGSTHKKHKIWMADMSQCLNLSLELETEFSINDQALNFELLDGHIGKFILCLIDDCCSSLANFLQIS